MKRWLVTFPARRLGTVHRTICAELIYANTPEEAAAVAADMAARKSLAKIGGAVATEYTNPQEENTHA